MLEKKRQTLGRGDGIGVLVPSSPIRESHRQAGLRVITDLGLRAREEPDPLAGSHYLSKGAGERVAALMDFQADGDLSAVWLARGGYGANLMLPELDRWAAPVATKPVYGSSDGCFLLWYLMDRWAMPVYLAPMIYASMTRVGGYDPLSLRWALFGEGHSPQPRGTARAAFSVHGRLHGGCLSMLAALAGTPWMPGLADTLLIIEDVNERPFRLDRMVWQLARSGSLNGVRGILFGQFPGCFKDEGEKDHFYGRMSDILGPLAIPFAWDFAIGHAEEMVTLPLGVPAELRTDGGQGQLVLL